MFTYLISDSRSKVLKIGKSKNPSKRLRVLQVGNGNHLSLVCFVEGDYEHELHILFAHLRIRGEFFYDSPVIRNKFEELLTETRKPV